MHETLMLVLTYTPDNQNGFTQKHQNNWHGSFFNSVKIRGNKTPDISIYNIQMQLNLIRNRRTNKHTQLDINVPFCMATF